jgi:hypothetical protein
MDGRNGHDRSIAKRGRADERATKPVDHRRSSRGEKKSLARSRIVGL